MTREGSVVHEMDEVFRGDDCNVDRLVEIDCIADPQCRYIIAMTPRSGSSYLCNVLEKTKCLGIPGEVINHEFMPEIIKKIPGRTPGEYFRNVSRVRKTKNDVYGLKCSWCQFEDFVNLMGGNTFLDGYKFIYLTRRNHSAQAVSLYKATASSVFHTNVTYDHFAVKKLEELEYDYNEIDKWYEHIIMQEKGWQEYFRSNRISPFCVSYEEIDENISQVVMSIALYLGVGTDNVIMPSEPSVFTKVSDQRNAEWASRYLLERYSKCWI